MHIREAEPREAEVLTNLINAAFRKAESFFIDGDRLKLDVVRDLFHSGEFLVAEDNAQVVGCVYLETRGDRAYLGLLSVQPERQRAGIGRMLMAAAEDRCRRQGHVAIDLQIVNLRRELPAYYGGLGYVESGTAPFPEDAGAKLPCEFIKMSKSLVPA